MDTPIGLVGLPATDGIAHELVLRDLSACVASPSFGGLGVAKLLRIANFPVFSGLFVGLRLTQGPSGIDVRSLF